eukprot:7056469-Prymnesium_polylepis.2
MVRKSKRAIAPADVVGDVSHMMEHQHAKLYWGATALLAMGVITGSQTIAILGWPEGNSPPHVEGVPSVALHTNVPWYAPARTSPTSEMDDRGFLRYATILLWLTVCITGLGMELVLGEPLVRAPLPSASTHPHTPSAAPPRPCVCLECAAGAQT